MNWGIRHILVGLFCCVVSLVSAGETPSIYNDSLTTKKNEKWYNQINKYRNVKNDSLLEDSLRTVFGKNYWKWAMLSGQLDLKDETIEYPGFVKWCVDVYNWAVETFNTYDTTYVAGTNTNWKLTLKNDNWIDNYNLRLPSGLQVRMSSSMVCNLGASISFLGVSLGFTTNIDKLFGNEPEKQKRWDFQFGCALLALDAYYSKSTGCINLTRLGDYGDSNFLNSTYKFSGLEQEFYGLDMYYFFNNKKYSQSAAYTQSRFQKKSAGSFIGGISLSRQDINMNFNKLPVDIIDELPQDKRNYHIKYLDCCLMLGYAYNWAINKNFLFNITAIPCVGYNHSLNGVLEDNRNLLALNFKTKMALVYNHNRFFCGLNGKIDGHFYNGNKYKFLNSVENISFITGFRF